jgi:indolepyruvate decarboxylase
MMPKSRTAEAVVTAPEIATSALPGDRWERPRPRRQRPLILVGDGAFQMTGWELGNCRRWGWDPIVIVFNNASWEMLRTFQPESKFNDLDDWRFADMAAGLGGEGVRVHTRRELKDALSRAAATRGRFQLIEAMIPRGTLSSTLQRFVAGVKRLSAQAQG